MPVSENHLIWIDLEMTGLDVDHDRIIEVATIVTDAELQVLAEGPVVAIHQPESVLMAMDEWNRTQHTQSGLWQRVLDSRIDVAEAERLTLAFLAQWVPAHRLMPELRAYFHYRHIDVSTLKELAQRWMPAVAEGIKKQSSHLALDDIRDSIAELRHYREHFLCQAARQKL
jgi:oligoribonuclease